MNHEKKYTQSVTTWNSQAMLGRKKDISTQDIIGVTQGGGIGNSEACLGSVIFWGGFTIVCGGCPKSPSV